MLAEPPVEALTTQDANLNLDHVEPARVLGCVMGSRPTFAYTNDARPFLDRDAAICRRPARAPDGAREDPAGMAIESFELHDKIFLTKIRRRRYAITLVTHTELP